MMPLALTRFALFSNPRRVLRGDISWSDAALLDPGSVVLATASDARDLDGSEGLANVALRITKLRRDAESQRAELEAVYHGVRGSGLAGP